MAEAITHCLLINPLTPEESQFSCFTDLTSSPPLGLGYIAAFLLERGINVFIRDELITPFDEKSLKETLLRMQAPRIVGLSCMTLNSSRAYSLSRMIKEIDPETIIYAGGIHPTVMAEEVINQHTIDGVVKGEGEETFHEIVATILDGSNSFENINGLIWKKDGAVIENPSRKLIKNLDDIPIFPYHLFDDTYHLYSTFANIISTRGCPFDCIFCSQRAMTQRKFRTHSLERIVTEIEILITQYNQSTITFSDDMVLASKPFFLRMLNAFIEKGFHKKAEFIMQARSDYIDREVAEKMKEANFTMLSFGIETGTERLTKLIKKEEKLEDHVKAINHAREAGIATNGVLIFGFPTETPEDRKETIRFAKNLPLDSVRFNVAIPYPGTELYEIAKRENRLMVKKSWENFAVQYYLISDDIPYVPENNSRYDLIYDTMKANLSFYLRPKVLLSMLSPKKLKYGGVINMNRKNSLQERFNMGFRLFKAGVFIGSRFLMVFLRSTFSSKTL